MLRECKQSSTEPENIGCHDGKIEEVGKWFAKQEKQRSSETMPETLVQACGRRTESVWKSENFPF